MVFFQCPMTLFMFLFFTHPCAPLLSSCLLLVFLGLFTFFLLVLLCNCLFLLFLFLLFTCLFVAFLLHRGFFFVTLFLFGGQRLFDLLLVYVFFLRLLFF